MPPPPALPPFLFLPDLLLSGWHLSLTTAYDLTVPAGWGFQQRVNTDWHLLHVVGGRGWYELDGESIPLQPGRLILISPGCRHSARPDPKNLPHIQPLRFSVVRDGGIARASIAVPVFAQHCLLPPGQSAWVTGLLSGMVHRLSSPSIHSTPSTTTLRNQADIAELLALVWPERDTVDNIPAIAGTSAANRIQELCRDIRRDPAQPWSGQDLAHYLGWSPKHAIRAFREHVGSTPHAFVVEARLDHARFLLTETDAPIHAIAERLGYPDSPTFCKQFQRYHARTPSAWRRQHHLQRKNPRS